jgi:hypothetical protein
MILGAAIGTILVGFPAGVLVGYVWRDRISRDRRARYWAERKQREMLRQLREAERASASLAPRNDH